jgi:hypothetical protein
MQTTQVPDYRRFTVAVKLNREELAALKRLTEAERFPAAQVLRRLIWSAAISETKSGTPQRAEVQA